VKTRLLWGVAIVLALLALGSAWADRRAEADSPRARAEAMRQEVRAAQAEAEECLAALELARSRFEAQTRQTEALGARIRRLEALDDRGVPADSYDVYLETVERFNASIEGWELRGEAVTEEREECLAVVEDRNLLADSLRRILVEMGYLPPEEDLTPPPEAPNGST
jgi:hypothetical protein